MLLLMTVLPAQQMYVAFIVKLTSAIRLHVLQHTMHAVSFQPEEQPYCEGMEFCTSQCFCTDGMQFTRDNETDQVFDGSDVDDQGTG